MFTLFEDCKRIVLLLPIISFLIIRQCAVNKTERSLSNIWVCSLLRTRFFFAGKSSLIVSAQSYAPLRSNRPATLLRNASSNACSKMSIWPVRWRRFNLPPLHGPEKVASLLVGNRFSQTTMHIALSAKNASSAFTGFRHLQRYAWLAAPRSWKQSRSRPADTCWK